jgi:hypothetical protein
VQNAEYDFAEPVVIIGGDFNTVDPENVKATYHHRPQVLAEKI